MHRPFSYIDPSTGPDRTQAWQGACLTCSITIILGFFVGPVQPINAELAVDVTYPGDETAVESVQQFGGNFCSALLVPVAGRAAKLDYQILPNIPVLASDIRGDVIFMMAISIATYCFYRSFDAPLRRSMMDGD